LGEEHPTTLTSMSDLAMTLQEQCQFIRAGELEEAVLRIRKRVLGEEHPGTLVSMSNLALNLCAQGQYTRATELQRAGLEIGKECWEKSILRFLPRWVTLP
jgi:hypothetical protein